MNVIDKLRAHKLAKMLNPADNTGLLVVQGEVVLRDGIALRDTPTGMDEADLQNAIVLKLLVKRGRATDSESGKSWDWYWLNPMRPRFK